MVFGTEMGYFKGGSDRLYHVCGPPDPNYNMTQTEQFANVRNQSHS